MQKANDIIIIVEPTMILQQILLKTIVNDEEDASVFRLETCGSPDWQQGKPMDEYKKAT